MMDLEVIISNAGTNVWIDFLSAIALVLVLEGIMPFVSPEKWKRLLFMVTQKNNQTLRIMGFISMMLGLVVLTLVHQIFE